MFQMAVVFQFHRINQHPLHLSYITFAFIAIIMLPSPNKSSDDSGRHCYDLGKIHIDGELANKWASLENLENIENTKNETDIDIIPDTSTLAPVSPK